MAVFKRTRRGKDTDGRTRVKRSTCWYVEYRGNTGILRRVKGCGDLAATRQKAAELEQQAARTDAGLIDKYATHRKRPLQEHLAAFREYLTKTKSPRTARYRTEQHVEKTVGRVTRVLEGCSFRFWGEIDPARIELYLGEHVDGATTHNHFVTALRQFSNWMLTTERAEVSPLARLRRRHVSRRSYRRTGGQRQVQ